MLAPTLDRSVYQHIRRHASPSTCTFGTKSTTGQAARLSPSVRGRKLSKSRMRRLRPTRCTRIVPTSEQVGGGVDHGPSVAQRLSICKKSQSQSAFRCRVGSMIWLSRCARQDTDLCDGEVGPNLLMLDGEPGHQNVRHAQQRDKCGARVVQLGPPQARPRCPLSGASCLGAHAVAGRTCTPGTKLCPKDGGLDRKHQDLPSNCCASAITNLAITSLEQSNACI